ncbi:MULTISPECIES: metallophosphoesterase family protein [unclassified Carboxylicivirga]|uniref:metallophosphoesterase family protein n=1 Tax=Carboxylicivirga TaxID=1628153 RepID=UPI003D356002
MILNVNRKVLIISFSLLLLLSCKDIIEYSPYENIVESKYKRQNISHYNRLLPSADHEFEPFRVALIADSHTYYDEFLKQVDYINSRDDFDFVIHLGDITLSANGGEFNWYSDIMNRIEVPVITIIGNHDCLGNGYDIYNEMFGASNFFFNYRDVKFVFFDNIVWEKKVTDPDFEWFNGALSNGEAYQHVIPFSHLPPWSEQFSLGNEYLFNELLKNNAIELSVHGHDHSYKLSQPYGDIHYLTVPAPIRDELIILDIQADTVRVERHYY